MFSIPIELIAVFLIFFIFLAGVIYIKSSLKKLQRRYNPKDDSSKKGQEAIAKEGRDNDKSRNTGNAKPKLNTSRLVQPQGRSSVQTKSINTVGKNSKRIRNPFKRRTKSK